MKMQIEPVRTGEDREAAAAIREEVFQREMGLRIEPPGAAPGMRRFDLVARSENGQPAGTLTVLETTGDTALHRACGLHFEAGAAVARYTQLAVRRPYRGMNVPGLLMVEAHRQFIEPEAFDFTWLLFPAHRASVSFLRGGLGFRPRPVDVMAEYGRCRAMVREERASYGRFHFRPSPAEIRQSTRSW